MRRDFERSEILAIYKAVQSGEKQVSIAKRFNRHPILVNRIARGQEHSKITGHQWTPKLGELARHGKEVIRLYRSGLFLYEIGERFGFSARTVRRYLIKKGVALRSLSETVKMSRARQKAKG